MQCVILAGGLATRLRPITEQIPKSMIEIHGRPFLEYQIDLLKKNNIRDIVLCVGYLYEQIKKYFGDGRDFGVNITYSHEKDGLLGTGGAIKNAEALLDADFFVMYGDSYLPIDFIKVHKYYKTQDANACMTVYKNKSLYDKSNVVFRNGIVVVYDKRMYLSEMEYIDYGLTILSKKVLNRIVSGVVFDLADVLGDLARNQELYGYEVFDRFYEVGSFDGIRDFENYMRGGRL